MPRPVSLDPHLVCQIEAIIDYVCRSSGGQNDLRVLAVELREAARRIEAEIEKRAGMFG